MNWVTRAQELLRGACTPWGIKASLVEKDNYGAIFTRDAVMAGVAGILLEDPVIIEGMKKSLFHLKDLQGKQGQIASNFTVKDGEVASVSFGTLSPKVDACTWYLVGVGLMLKEGLLDKAAYQASVESTIALLDALEYNGKHLIYIPKGGNWADEYIYEGYVLYDQVLRAWGLALLAPIYDQQEWSDKSQAILECIRTSYTGRQKPYFYSSFYPGGVFDKFDLAAHALAGMIMEKDEVFFDKSLDWIFEEFVANNLLPPAFYPAITEQDTEWDMLSKYHLFDFKNKPHHYHNGGIWWIWLGWLAITLASFGKKASLQRLAKNAFNYLDNTPQFNFEEYLSADKLRPCGTAKLCYTATGIIFLALASKSFDFSKLKK